MTNEAVEILVEACKISPTIAMKAYHELLDRGFLVAKPIDFRFETKATRILRVIKSTLDAPTLIEPAANCRNLTKTLQEVEKICRS